jgi:hypothetical protein
MKEIHAYRNEDGTYKLEVVMECIDKGDPLEARIIYPRTKIEPKDFILKPFGELFAVTVEDGDGYVTI